MGYADHFVWLKMSFERIQNAQNSVMRLPYGEKRRKVLEFLDAAERALGDLDRELEELEELAHGTGEL